MTATSARSRPASAATNLPLADLAACCSPTNGKALDQSEATRLAGVLKALAEPNRLRLMSLIAANTSVGATCVCDLIEPVGLSQPTVSHHLKILTDAGLLEREQRGKWAYYSLVPAALTAIATAISPNR